MGGRLDGRGGFWEVLKGPKDKPAVEFLCDELEPLLDQPSRATGSQYWTPWDEAELDEHLIVLMEMLLFLWVTFSG